MDLELLFRACWRHKFRIIGAALAGAVLMVGVGLVTGTKQYSSSADVSVTAVFPSANSPAAQVYTLQPDRYVATQIPVVTSPQAAAEAARKVGVSAKDVTDAVTVSQIGKSDILRVSATTEDPKLSARMVTAVTAVYIDSVRKQTVALYTDQIASVDEQIAEVNREIAQLTRANGSAGAANQGGSEISTQLQSLSARKTQLQSQRLQYVVEKQTQSSPARVVSDATVNPVPVGPGNLAMAFYGAALGIALACVSIAFGSRPGQTLDELDNAEEFDSRPVIGLYTRDRRFRFRRVAPVDHLRTMAVVERLARLVQERGSVQLVVVGPRRNARELRKVLVPAVQACLKAEAVALGGSSRWVAVGEFNVVSLETFLPGQVAPGDVAVGIDLAAGSRSQLEDVLAGLEGIGAKVHGIVGLR